MTMVAELKSQIKKKETKRNRKDDPLGELSDKLNSLGHDGRVTSVLVFDPVRGRINCYGEHLNDGRILRKVNVSIGGRGRGIARSIAYPEIVRLKSYHNGWFVPAEEFWKDNESYVALVNIPWNSQDADGVIPYRLGQ